VNGETDFADCELAWTSFNTAVRKFKWRWQGMLQQNMRDKEIRIHPTQKPVALYRWLLTNYAKPGQTILDTHGGSFSSAIACWHEGYDMDIIEIDREYFDAACKRFERETRQHKLFPTSGAK
jgi:site-specific DNA-methyltransferase (adenine-specific)